MFFENLVNLSVKEIEKKIDFCVSFMSLLFAIFNFRISVSNLRENII